MIGKLYYRYRTRFGHGFRTAWQRDVVRWRILKTPPVHGLMDDACEIHVLTCERDWIDLPFVYETGQRAILTFEKGSQGDQVFQKAMAAWKTG